MDSITCWPTVTILRLSFRATVWTGWCQVVSSFHCLRTLKGYSYISLIYNNINKQILTFEILALQRFCHLICCCLQIALHFYFPPHTFHARVFHPDNRGYLFLHLAGMPDFLDKLHTAALRAKNLEVGIYDYVGVIKSSDANRQPSQERLSGEKPHTGGPGQIYAWDGRFINQGLCWCIFHIHTNLIKPSSLNYLG